MEGGEYMAQLDPVLPFVGEVPTGAVVDDRSPEEVFALLGASSEELPTWEDLTPLQEEDEELYN